MVVLPSPGSALTKVKERGGRPAAESNTDVRKPRKASESAECWVPFPSMRIQAFPETFSKGASLPFPLGGDELVLWPAHTRPRSSGSAILARESKRVPAREGALDIVGVFQSVVQMFLKEGHADAATQT